MIPKKTVEKPNVDESAIAAFKRRKEEAEREKEREAARKKEELIRLRLEAHGGKVCGQPRITMDPSMWSVVRLWSSKRRWSDPNIVVQLQLWSAKYGGPTRECGPV